MIRLFPKDVEASLLRKARKGDAAAIKAIYDANVQYLAGTCRRYITSDDDIKDILQESFIRIFSSLDRFEYRGRGSLRAWMSRVVVNESLMFLRKNRLSERISLDDPLPDIPQEEDPDTEGIPPDVLMDMISKLPPGGRTILNLYVFEQKSHREIAELLGIKENSSTSQFHRAKAMLAGMIRQYRNEQGLEK